MATPSKRFVSTLSDKECIKRVGAAYNISLPWEDVLDEELKQWLDSVAGSRKCRPEYVFLAMLPTISVLCGPDVMIAIDSEFHLEKLNIYLCLLGATGASKY